MTTFQALLMAARRAAHGKTRSPRVASWLVDLEPNLFALERALCDDTWRPGPFRTFEVREPKPRRISAVGFADRVVHQALCTELEPLIERVLIPRSAACRRGKGTHAALRWARQLARRHSYFLKLDIRHYFETIPHATVKSILARLLSDERALLLCERILDAGAPGSEPGRGLPIGNLTSQHFANLTLSAVDHAIVDDCGLPGVVRYMDDILVFADSPSLLSEAEGRAREVACALGLEIKESARRLGPVAAGVPFLGFRIFPGLVRLDGAHRARLIRTLRADSADDDLSVRRLSGVLGWADMAHTLALRRSCLAALGRRGADTAGS